MTVDTPDPVARAAALAIELRAAGDDFAAAMLEAGAAAKTLAKLDGEYNAACAAADIARDVAPPARELAAEVALAALASLRPFIGYVPADSGRLSAEALRRFGTRREVEVDT